MRLEEFDYHLPEDRIAQRPCEMRDHARMMVINRKTGSIIHDTFLHIPHYLQKGDALIVNNSKVIPAKLREKRESGGSVEMLLLSRKSDDTSPCPVWEVLLKPARRMQVGDKIFFHNRVHATITRRISEKKWLITLVPQMDFEAFLSGYGNVTLPPYIKRKNDDASHHNDTERYQTVYAKIPGSVAAPTAGLHFSELILDVLEKKGVHVVSVTLHVGYGTFLPVESSHVEEHVMEEEHFVIDKDASDIINSAGNVIAVGTTSTRVIESVADEKGTVRAHSSSTDLFIYPGYRFRRVNTLLTNFHLPRSSLFLLVCAFAGTDLIHEAYRRAIENGYRFYSYGDCMLIM